MLGIHALSASLSIFEESGIDKISRIIINNTKYIIDYITNNSNFILLSPDQESQLGGIVTFKIDGYDSRKLHHKLMNNNVICANRMGGIRLSPHFYTSREKINKSHEIINSII